MSELSAMSLAATSALAGAAATGMVSFLDRLGERRERASRGERVGLPTDPNNDYFAVCHAMVGSPGELAARQIAPIVRFYGYCKLVIDSRRSGSPYGPSARNAGIIGSIAAFLLEPGGQIERTSMRGRKPE